MKPIRKILLATDLSETSKAAIDPAVTFAETFGAELLVVYVDDDRLPPLVLDYMAVGMEELRQKQHESSTELLGRFVEEHLGAEFAGRLEVPFGVPHVEIVRLAVEEEVDLIVIATHGRGFISHAVMGSTTERVLRRAPCAVLVVRESGD